MSAPDVAVPAFVVFGTVVGWRTGIARAATAVFAGVGRADIDPAGFADAWRGIHQPAVEKCRSGRRPYVRLDQLDRETLDVLHARNGVVAEAAAAHLATARRRLDPWPDAVAGRTRMKARLPVVMLSNGNVAPMPDLARHGGRPWDAILGAEAAGQYGPRPQACAGTADILGIAPARCASSPRTTAISRAAHGPRRPPARNWRPRRARPRAGAGVGPCGGLADGPGRRARLPTRAGHSS